MTIDNEENVINQEPGPPLGAPKIGGFEIIEMLGRGGMSVVYKARQKTIERLVAVKVLSGMNLSEPSQVKRFQNEAKITSALEHENIIKVISFGVSQEGEPYLAMELVQGKSLDVELKQNGRLSLAKFKSIFLPALSALDYAHKNGVIHRDIKPGNIMICEASADNDNCSIKLLDFGIAKLLPREGGDQKGLTKTGISLGSPLYMSPEQCIGKDVEGASDLYSLACVMYETLRGEPPFTADTVLELLQKKTTAAPPTVADFTRAVNISSELAKSILWGLEREKSHRPASACEWAARLAQCLSGVDTTIVPKLNIGDSKTTKNNFIKGAATLGATIVITLAIFSFLKNRQGKSTLPDKLRHSNDVIVAKDKNNIEAFRRKLSKPNLSIAERVDYGNRLAERLWQDSRYSESKIEYEKLVDLYDKTPNRNNEIFKKSLYAAWLTEIARCCFMLKQFPETLRMAEKSITFCESNPQLGKQKELAAYSTEAQAYAETKQDSKAVTLFNKSLVLRRELPNDNRRTVADGLMDLAAFYAQREQLSKAEPLLKEAYKIGQETADQTLSQVPIGALKLAEVYYREKEYAKAQKIYEDTIDLGLEPHLRFSTLLAYGRCMLDSGNSKNAVELYEQALDAANESQDPAEVADAQRHISDALQKSPEPSIKEKHFAEPAQNHPQISVDKKRLAPR